MYGSLMETIKASDVLKSSMNICMLIYLAPRSTLSLGVRCEETEDTGILTYALYWNLIS